MGSILSSISNQGMEHKIELFLLNTLSNFWEITWLNQGFRQKPRATCHENRATGLSKVVVEAAPGADGELRLVPLDQALPKGLGFRIPSRIQGSGDGDLMWIKLDKVKPLLVGGLVAIFIFPWLLGIIIPTD